MRKTVSCSCRMAPAFNSGCTWTIRPLTSATADQTLLLRQSLENFRDMDREMAELKQANKTLQEDLEKREEAIQRLRELTLGQPGAAP